MGTCRFEDRVPQAAQLTDYDESHLHDYLRLLDADDSGIDWREAAASIFCIDVAAEPDRALTMYVGHLARARWMTEIGYAHLMGCSPSLKH
jgi:hypothetical protein